MAEYIKTPKLPDDCNIIATSDWHIGAKAFHEKAARSIVKRLEDEPDTFAIHGGDLIEGKKVDSPHFSPQALDRDKAVIEEQLDYAREEFFAPVAPKWLGVGIGNHELYLMRDINPVKHILCNPAGIPMGGYQTWYDLGGFRIFYWHGRVNLPRGAKDPIQRDANQRAWLVNRLAPLAGDCRVMLMGHCFDEETEILTPDGWKRHGELSVGDEVMTLNRERGNLEYNNISQVHRYDHYKELIRCEGRSIDLLVTPGHGLWSAPDASGRYREETAEDAFGKQRKFMQSAIHEDVGLGASLTDDQVRFIAWVMAEGSVHYEIAGNYGRSIRIAQSDAPDGRLAALESAISGAGFSYGKSMRYQAGTVGHGQYRNYDAYRLGIHGADEVVEWMRPYLDVGKMPTRRLARMDAGQIRVFLDTYVMADGNWHRGCEGHSGQISSKEKHHIDFLQELVVRVGGRSRVWLREDGRNGSKCWVMSFTLRNETYIHKGMWSKEAYDGTVWCVTVPNGTLLVRRNGKHVITLNTHALLKQDPVEQYALLSRGQTVRARHFIEPDETVKTYNPKTRKMDVRRFIPPLSRFYGNTGTLRRSGFFGGIDYGEVGGFAPAPIGYLELKVRGGQPVALEKVIV